jgi:E3 ubiquitin-protein ligase UBR2
MTLAFYEQERVSNFEFYSKLQKFEIDKLIDQLDSNLPSKADICKELISHVNKVYRKFNETNGQVNLSTTTVNINQEILDSTKKAQRKRKDLAAQKRAKIIAQMIESQKSFIEKNIQLCSESIDESQNSVTESTSPGIYSTFSSMINSSDQQIFSTSPNTPLKFEPMIVEDYYPVIQSCLGTNDSELSPPMKQVLTCIFCQENSEVKLNSEALVLSAYVQNSRVLSKNRTRRIENWDTFDPTFMSNDLHWGVHVSSCGHAIHASCWTK